MTTFGLPRNILSLLRQMEAYKEFLKWEINEASHKITLRLTWNFRKHVLSAAGAGPASPPSTPQQQQQPTPPHGANDSLWRKLQRSMKRGTTNDNRLVPEDLSRFLDKSPKRSSETKSAFARRLSWARLSAFSLPARWRHSNSTGAAKNSSLTRSSSASAPHHRPPPTTSPSRLSLPISPSRYSWPGTATTADTPITSTPDSIRSEGRSVHITYRMREDIARSLEDLADQVHRRNRLELSAIKRQWDSAVGPDVSSDSEDLPEVNLGQVDATVKQCLRTCDSILHRHSTLIL